MRRVGHWLVGLSIAIMTGAAELSAGHASSGAVDVFSCDVLAPFQSTCTTGNHAYEASIGLGFADAGGYVGRGTNVLGWSGGTATVTCLFAGTILFPTCNAMGVPPPAGEPFNHTCKGEGVLMTPAAGTLRCVISHD